METLVGGSLKFGYLFSSERELEEMDTAMESLKTFTDAWCEAIMVPFRTLSLPLTLRGGVGKLSCHNGWGKSKWLLMHNEIYIKFISKGNLTLRNTLSWIFQKKKNHTEYSLYLNGFHYNPIGVHITYYKTVLLRLKVMVETKKFQTLNMIDLLRIA